MITTKLEKIQHRHRQGLSGSYTLLEPVNHKTSIRGYWTDKRGKVYKDNLILRRFEAWTGARHEVIRLCYHKDQQCIFIKGIRVGYIVDKQGMIINTFKSKHIIPLKSKKDIRQAIRQHKDRLTIYKTLKGYYAEVYK